MSQIELEEAVVRVAASSLGVLQNFRRVPTAAAPRPLGSAFVHESEPQEAREHVRTRFSCSNILSPGQFSG